jgi:hypothetical protein
MSCPLDSYCQLALVFSAVTGDSPGKYLASFRNILSDFVNFLVVDIHNFIDAEAANFFLCSSHPHTALAFALIVRVSSASVSFRCWHNEIRLLSQLVVMMLHYVNFVLEWEFIVIVYRIKAV